MRICVLIILFLAAYTIQAQEIILDKIVDDTVTIPDIGPNSKKHTHFFISAGSFISKNSEGISLNGFKSVKSEIGIRHKRKINEALSLGINFSYTNIQYNIKSDSLKTFPTITNYDHEKLKLNSLNLEIFNRFNFGHRGNYMGIFTDIGIVGSWNFKNRYTTIEITDDLLSKNIITNYTHPSYLHPFTYGWVIRAGANNVVIWASGSLSALIDQDKYNQDIKGFWLGLQFGLHR